MMTETLNDFAKFKMSQVANGQVPIDETLEIEDALITLLAYERKIEHLRNIKKRRAMLLDEEIKKNEQHVENIRTAIQNCMETNKEKILEFPGVGKATVTKKKGTWTILDQEKLEQDLQKRGLLDSVSEVERTIKKKELNKLLDELEKNRNIPEAVQRDPEKTSISVSFGDAAGERAMDKQIEMSSSIGSSNGMKDFDKLEI